jgi:hypothetical protein
MDKGAKPGAGGIMCVAAALFEAFPYDLFLHEWQPILDEWGAPAFHATDFYPGGGKYFWRKRKGEQHPEPERAARYERHCREIPQIIARHVRQLFIITIRPSEYEAIAPATWRARFGGPHRVVAQMMVAKCGWWADKTGYDGEIAYFYETGDDEGAQVEDALDKLWDDPVKRKHGRMAATPIGVPKGRARGLEVADFLAWHWNKWWVETLIEKERPIRTDIQTLMELVDVRRERISVTPLIGEPLVHFLLEQGCNIRSSATR